MAFKLKYLGQEAIFQDKVALKKLLPDQHQYLCAKVNLTIFDQDAVRTYETTLRYLLAMAVYQLNPSYRFRFSYHISRSIFMEFSQPKKIDPSFVEKINQKLTQLVQDNVSFDRLIVPKEEAIQLYEKLGYTDKVDILKYRPEKTVHFYQSGTYTNYMFGMMAISSRLIKDWKLIYYPPGIIIQYPRSEMKGKIPVFEDAPMFGQTFCIAGPSSSGKTTFANRLRIELMTRGFQPIRISIDDYYLPKNEAPKDSDGKPDLENIHALNLPLFNQHLAQLINGETVTLPQSKFDASLGKAKTLKIQEDTLIIIEGIHALNDALTSLVPKTQKYKIYISPQSQINYDHHNPMSLTDLRLLRRMVRDKKYRGSSAEQTIDMWPSVRRGEFTWIYKTQEEADYVFNSFLPYELCVMKRYAIPLLSAIQKESTYFPTAERLMRMLKYFVDMEEKWIPSNSLIREFIGGSCFREVED